MGDSPLFVKTYDLLVITHMSRRPQRFHFLQQNSRHFALDRRYFDTLLAQNLGGLRWR